MQKTGCRGDAEGVEENGDIEAAVVENLLAGRIGEHGDEVRRFLLAGRDADHVGRAVARRKLHDAKSVAARHKAQRLGVDGNRSGVAGGICRGNIALMVTYGGRHLPRLSSKTSSGRYSARHGRRYR